MTTRGSRHRPGALVTAVLAVGLLLPTSLSAQFSKPPAEAKPPDLFRVEIFKPTFKSGDYTFPTAALFVTIRQSVEGPVSVELKVPFGYVGTNSVSGSDWEFRPANPYLGFSWTSPENPAMLGFGLHVPILPDDADVRILRVADIHRYEAFAPDLWNFSMHSVVGGDTDPFQARTDMNLWIPLHGDVELVSNYSLTVRRPVVNLLVGLQLRGRAGITGSNLVFGERTMHEAGLTVEFMSNSFRPGFLARTPIQGRDVVDWVFGVTASFE